MPTPAFDLQSHSVNSDGELSATEVVRAAAAAGVQLLALTDHDTVEGVGEALRAAERSALRVVPGVEISVIDPAGADLHICGYLVDIGNRALQHQLERSRSDRERRALRMGDALRALGFALDEGQLAARIAEGGSLGRPHLAQAVLAHPGNGARLAAEGLSDASTFLEAYLIEGKPAFCAREAPAAADAIELIHGAGGLAVWAHPFWDISADPGVLETLGRFAGVGLDGVEAFYVTHTAAQTKLLVDRCAELGMLTTGSSDYHGPHHRQFNRFLAYETYGLMPNLGPIADA